MEGEATKAYAPRHVDSLLENLCTEVPVILLVGARATGKTTTAARLAKTVIRLDRPSEAAPFLADADAVLAEMELPVLLDEWQMVPEILGAVKRAVDAGARAGSFLLTGSVHADLQGKTWPGTGRVVRVRMQPLTVDEQHRQLAQPLIDRAVSGSPLRGAEDPLTLPQ